jgi:hypothetical protein
MDVSNSLESITCANFRPELIAAIEHVGQLNRNRDALVASINEDLTRAPAILESTTKGHHEYGMSLDNTRFRFLVEAAGGPLFKVRDRAAVALTPSLQVELATDALPIDLMNEESDNVPARSSCCILL